jgi:DNA (cytosine-5)-methyltransferase 1
MMRYLSLFSGIEAATVAWHPLGWECVGVAEIEPFPCAVLAHHYPNVHNLGSVTDITDEQIAALGRIDVVVGGSPCQDLSVAGKRAGLAGARSGLFAHQMRIFHAARSLCGARWLLWENVPGAFCTNAGRDFAVVASEMAGSPVAVPADGWGTEGLALGSNGLLEWAVLDAQWFGVAQRRRRVFAVLDTGDWSGRGPVLLEPDSMRGDSAPSRSKRQGTTHGPAGGAAADSRQGLFCEEVTSALCAADNQGGDFVVQADQAAFSIYPSSGQGSMLEASPATISPALNVAGADNERGTRVVSAMQVRRLTPTECERLQGFPDGYTAIPWRNKPADQCPDPPRYKALGNSMAVPVMAWIGRQIQREHGGRT